jgi:branched-subunit amino acid ABC-type transport system permease component
MTVIASQWAQIVLYAVAAIVLLVRPEGILGSTGVN